MEDRGKHPVIGRIVGGWILSGWLASIFGLFGGILCGEIIGAIVSDFVRKRRCSKDFGAMEEERQDLSGPFKEASRKYEGSSKRGTGIAELR